MYCCRCKSTEYCKSGFTKGKQRYRCLSCGYNFTNLHGRGHSPDKRATALLLNRHGLGYRRIGAILEVSDVTVLNWVRESGEKIKEQMLSHLPEDQADMDIIEIDEMWHYTKKNSENCGYGLLCLVPQDASSLWKWALVARNPLKDSGQDSST